MAKDQHSEVRLKILMEQLQQARAAMTRGQEARYRLMNGGALVMLALLLFSYTSWLTMSALALPFAVIYVVVQCGYLTHGIIGSRAQIAALESKINAEIGEPLMVSEPLESGESGPLGESHFLGVSTVNPMGIASAAMLHYLILCVILFVAGWLRSNFILGRDDLVPVRRLADIYVPILILWAVINVGYLMWFFLTSDREKKLVAEIRDAYERKGE